MRMSDWSSDVCSSDLRIRLADQQGKNSGKSLAPFNEFRDRVGQVVEVDRRLRRAEHSRIQVCSRAMLIDSRDLLGEKRRMAHVVIDAGNPEQGDGYVAVPFAEQRLGFGFRLGIGPERIER